MTKERDQAKSNLKHFLSVELGRRNTQSGIDALAIHKAVEKQKVLKREIAELVRLIRELEND